MCAMIYRHRPSYTALVGAAVTLIAGSLLMLGLTKSTPSAEGVPASVLLAGCVTFLIFGFFLIVAFARYRFTHLWRTSKPAPQKAGHHQVHTHAHAHSARK